MIKAVLILLFLCVPSFAEGPIYEHKDRITSLEFDNVYRDLRGKVTNSSPLPSRTSAELTALAPSVSGILYYCSDCATDAVCVSTGTTAGSFARVSARTTLCQ